MYFRKDTPFDGYGAFSGHDWTLAEEWDIAQSDTLVSLPFAQLAEASGSYGDRSFAYGTRVASAVWAPDAFPHVSAGAVAASMQSGAADQVVRGFQATYYLLNTTSLRSTGADVDTSAGPAATGTVEALDYLRVTEAFWEDGAADHFAATYSGLLTVETAGQYTFMLQADDGASLSLNGQTYLESPDSFRVQKNYLILDLEAGTHEIDVTYADTVGLASLNLQWSGADTGGVWTHLSGDAVTYVAAPGGGDDVPDVPSETAQALLGQANANAGVGLDDPSLAVGLGRYNYYSSPPFLNLMKQAKPVQTKGAEGEKLEAWDLAEMGLLDENGYPTQMVAGTEHLSEGARAYQYAVSLHHSSDAVVAETSGDYVIEWSGNGAVQVRDLTVTDAVTFYDENNNVIGGQIRGHWADDADVRYFKILETDPDNHIRDVSIVKAEYKDLYDAGAVFDPRYLDVIDDYQTLRFMDWMGTNGSDVTSIADVMSPDSATWWAKTNASSTPDVTSTDLLPTAAQIPFEVLVQLANEAGADPWFNIPLKADDDYVRALVAYVDEHLDDGLVAKFELSNEVWNWAGGFDQTREASLLGSDGAVPNNLQYAREYYGYRSAQIRDIMNEVAPDSAMQLIMGTWTVNTDAATMTEDGVLAYFKEQGRTGGVSDVFDAVAITGYFSGLNDDAFIDLRAYWYSQSEALFAQGATQSKYAHFIARANLYLTEGVYALNPEEIARIATDDKGEIKSKLVNPLEGYQRDNVAANKALAEAWGVELVQYEADSHISPKKGQEEIDSEWFKALNKSPEMAALTARMLEIFREEGGTLANDYDHMGESQIGLWGTRDHLADENPISIAYDSYNATAADTYGSINTDRQAGVFLQGITETGTDQGDVLIGTAKRDYLLGGAGDDLFVGGAGVDGINGGDGVDMALFSGRSEDFDFSVDDLGRLIVGQDGVADQLVQVELVAFADSGEVLRVADWTGDPSAASLEALIADFVAGNPEADALGWF